MLRGGEMLRGELGRLRSVTTNGREPRQSQETDARTDTEARVEYSIIEVCFPSPLSRGVHVKGPGGLIRGYGGNGGAGGGAVGIEGTRGGRRAAAC